MYLVPAAADKDIISVRTLFKGVNVLTPSFTFALKMTRASISKRGQVAFRSPLHTHTQRISHFMTLSKAYLSSFPSSPWSLALCTAS